MTATIGTLQKSVESHYEALSPIEKARWFSNEIIDTGRCEARGEDVTTREEEIRNFIKQYVNTLSDWDYACYLKELDHQDIRYWTGAYFTAAINGFIREEALISMLIIYKTNHLIRDLLELKKGKAEYLRGRIDTSKEHITGYKRRRKEINDELKAILSASFWDTWNIPRPDIKPIFDQDYYDLVDDLELDIEAYEKRKAPAPVKRVTRTRKIKQIKNIDLIDLPVTTETGHTENGD